MTYNDTLERYKYRFKTYLESGVSESKFVYNKDFKELVKFVDTLEIFDKSIIKKEEKEEREDKLKKLKKVLNNALSLINQSETIKRNIEEKNEDDLEKNLKNIIERMNEL